MRAIIYLDLVCPKCGFIFEKQKDKKTMRCGNHNCELYNILYKIPSYKLEIVNKSKIRNE